MKDDSELRRIAGESIAKGMLPSRAPQQTWGGPGTGAKCALCRGPIGTDQMEFEVDFGRSIGRYTLHLACFSAWEAERKAIGAAAPVIPSDEALDTSPAPLRHVSASGDKKAALPTRHSGGNITAHGGESAYKPGSA